MNVYQNVNVTGDATVSGKVTAQTLEADALGAKAQAAVKALISAVYPVGAYYLSGSPTEPGSIIGGTWEQIKGKFLFASDDVLTNGVITTAGTYHAGLTGGEATHTLTTEEMPAHAHDVELGINWSPGNFQYLVQYSHEGSPTGRALATRDTGGGKSHNNMPPYLVVYMWKRIA